MRSRIHLLASEKSKPSMASAVIFLATIKSCCSVTPPIVIGADTVPSTLIGTPSTPTSLWVTIGFSPALVGFILSHTGLLSSQ